MMSLRQILFMSNEKEAADVQEKTISFQKLFRIGYW
jgi:hypothetical protein